MNSYEDIIDKYNLIFEKKSKKGTRNPENTALRLLIRISNAKGYDKYQFGKKAGLSNLISLINSKAEDNNYFGEALIGKTSNDTTSNASSSNKTNSDEDEDEDTDMGITGEEEEDNDNMLKESSFIKTYKLILQQIPASQPTSKQTNKKNDGKNPDNGKKQNDPDLFAAAAKQMHDDEGTITLKVTSKNYFMFYETESNERVESKETIKKIDNYLQLHGKEILRDQIKSNQENAQNNKVKAYTDGIEEGYAELQKLSLTAKKINKDGLSTIVNNELGSEIFDRITQKITFGDGTLDKGQYQQVYACFASIIIGILAVIYKKQGKISTVSLDDSDNSDDSNDPKITALNNKISSISIDDLKELIKRKMTLSGKNPHDKKYLKSLFKYENTHWLPKNRKKYKQALNQLIAEA